MVQVERIPAREQGINLEAPRQFEHVLEGARLGLWNIDRFLLLVDAGFHAVIANAVAGGGDQRVVDGDDGKCGDGVAGGLQSMEFGNLFFQRTSRQGHAQRAFLEDHLAVGAGFLLQPGRARVLALIVAPDAVIGLGERTLEIRALVGQGEAGAAADVLGLDGKRGDAIGLVFLCMNNEILLIELGRELEQHTGAVALAAGLGVHRPCGVTQGEVDGLLVGRLVRQPGFHLFGESEFAEGTAEALAEFGFQCNAVEGRRGVGFVFGHRLALHELALDAIERGKFLVTSGERTQLAGDSEQLREEAVQVRPEIDDQRRLVFLRQHLRGEAAGREPLGERRIGVGKIGAKSGVELQQALAPVEVGKGKAVGKFQRHGIKALPPKTRGSSVVTLFRSATGVSPGQAVDGVTAVTLQDRASASW